jgi:hypothetical protein
LDSLLVPLEQHQYPKVKYWRKQDWLGSKNQLVTEAHNKIGMRGKTRIAAGENVSYGFVEDENGLTVNGFRMSTITQQMREIWAEIHDKNMAPQTWGKGTPMVKNFFRAEM